MIIQDFRWWIGKTCVGNAGFVTLPKKLSQRSLINLWWYASKRQPFWRGGTDMNKLDVALKLLQLLNERKTIDSKIVAHELSVSLRTAQRYLMELSILPCVSNEHNNHTYSLNSDYLLNGALIHAHKSDNDSFLKPKYPQKQDLSKSICLVCGNNRGFSDSITNINILSNSINTSNINKIDKLAAIITKRLKNGRCSFP
jgi:sulfur relay (sulfurtransferase) complex TusBCD TusD component (DsrE family)